MMSELHGKKKLKEQCQKFHPSKSSHARFEVGLHQCI